MLDFLKGIIIFITTITIPISGLFVHSKPVTKPTIAPTPIISISISPTPKKLSPTPSQKIIENENSYQYNSVPNTPILNPEPQNSRIKTYPIIPIGDLSSLSTKEKQQMIEIYNEFLKTLNLQYLTPQQQEEIFKQKASTYLDNYKRQLEQEKRQLQENVNQLNQQLNQIPPTDTPIPTATPFISPEIEAVLAQLNQTLTDIENKPVAMSIIEGRRQRAYEDWVANNGAIYAQIVGSRYKNNLNTILTAHGMWYYSLQ